MMPRAGRRRRRARPSRGACSTARCRRRPGARGLVGADQQLLTGLATGVEGARDLHPAERAVVEQAAVLAGERHALRDALVDDVRAHLGQAVDVRLARAVVAALDGVVEEPVDGVAVALVVLGGVDAALGGDRVGAARGVLVAERLHDVARPRPAWPRRSRRRARADHDDREPPPVGGVRDPRLELAGVPALLDRAAGCLGVTDRFAGRVVAGGVVGELRRRRRGLRRRGRVLGMSSWLSPLLWALLVDDAGEHEHGHEREAKVMMTRW